MAKVNILRLDSVTNNDTTATSSINTNFMAIQEAMENTLSRDGTTPNFMDSDLDMNSYRIINAGDPENDTDVITKGWFDQYVEDAAGASATAVAAADRAEGSAQTAQTAAAQASIAVASAEDDARLARDWAIKMDGPVEGDDYSSKYSAHLILDDTGFQAVAADLQDPDSAIENCSDNMEAINAAPDYAEEARVWATGEDAEVDEYEEGEHSSRGYADLAMAIANTPEDVPIDVGGLLALDVIRGERGEGVPEMYGQSGKWLTTDGHDGVWSDISYSVLTNKPTNVSTWVNDADYQSGTQVSTAISTLLNTIYPVGSTYITTSNTCPLSSLIEDSTWVLISSGVVTSLNSTAPVKGTGKALGVFDGTTTKSMVSGPTYPNQDRGGLYCSAAYSTATLPATSGESNFAGSYLLGITTDSDKSGIITDTSSLANTLSINIFERTA